MYRKHFELQSIGNLKLLAAATGNRHTGRYPPPSVPWLKDMLLLIFEASHGVAGY